MKHVPTKARLIISLTVLWLGQSDRLAAQTAGVLREVYTGIGGTTVADLTNDVNFPNNPSAQEVLTDFEAPTDVDNDYGQRLTAYVVPPASGDYLFWIASDDNSALFLSTDDTPAKKQGSPASQAGRFRRNGESMASNSRARFPWWADRGITSKH